VTARLRVDLNAITKNKVHGLIEGYKDAPNKLAIVKEDAHNDPVGIGRSQPRSGADSNGNGRMGSGGGHAEGGATVYSSSKVGRRGGRSNSAGHVGGAGGGDGDESGRGHAGAREGGADGQGRGCAGPGGQAKEECHQEQRRELAGSRMRRPSQGGAAGGGWVEEVQRNWAAGGGHVGRLTGGWS
jgi:hypothetical protein